MAARECASRWLEQQQGVTFVLTKEERKRLRRLKKRGDDRKAADESGTATSDAAAAAAAAAPTAKASKATSGSFANAAHPSASLDTAGASHQQQTLNDDDIRLIVVKLTSTSSYPQAKVRQVIEQMLAQGRSVNAEAVLKVRLRSE